MLENSTETCTLPYVKEINSASSMHEAGHQKPVLWENPEGQSRKGGGRGVQDRENINMCVKFTLMYGKNCHNIVK